MVYYDPIDSTPSAFGNFDGSLGEAEIAHVACEHFDLVGELVVELVERGVGPGDEDDFVVVGE